MTQGGVGLGFVDDRTSVPVPGRSLTVDPIGHAGGPNLYAYCDNSPLTKIDPDGKDPSDLLKQFFTHRYGTSADRGRRIMRDHAYINPGLNASWNKGFSTAWDWAYGTGPSRIEYPWGSMESQNVINSAIGWTIASRIRGMRNGDSLEKQGIGTGTAFLNSVLEPSNGTQFQLGAVRWNAYRKHGLTHVKVWNKITHNSLFLHVGIPPVPAGQGRPMGTVTQVFRWVSR